MVPAVPYWLKMSHTVEDPPDKRKTWVIATPAHAGGQPFRLNPIGYFWEAALLAVINESTFMQI